MNESINQLTECFQNGISAVKNGSPLEFYEQASDNEIAIVLRVFILLVGGLSTLMALKIPVLTGLWKVSFKHYFQYKG